MSYSVHDLFDDVMKEYLKEHTVNNSDITFLDIFLSCISDIAEKGDYKQITKIEDLANMILDITCEDRGAKISAIAGDSQYFVLLHQGNKQEAYGVLPENITMIREDL
jgi:accessory colonization factor AcfC